VGECARLDAGAAGDLGHGGIVAEPPVALPRVPVADRRVRAVEASDEAGFIGEHDGLGAVAHGTFHEHVCDVRLYRRLSHDQLGRDFGVGQAASTAASAATALPW
jgi:hypothetical protein